MNKRDESRSVSNTTEAFVKKYWLPVYNRCLRLLALPSLSREIAAECLVRAQEKQGDTPDVSGTMKMLYQISTVLCMEKILGEKRRNTDWLRTLEIQKDQHAQDAGKAEQQRQNLLDIMEMSQADMRPFILYRFLERLSLGSTAMLCDLSEQEAEEKQDKFFALANQFLKNKGLEPISAPEKEECPDAFVMDKIFTGDTEGLDDEAGQVQQHEPCVKLLEKMRAETESLQEDLPRIMEEIKLSSQRLSEEKKVHSHGPPKKQMLLPALLAALATGALLWILFPGTKNEQGDVSDFLGYRLMLLENKDGKQQEIKSGQEISPGEELGIMLSSIKPMSARILSIGEKDKPRSLMPPSVFSWPVTDTIPQKLPFAYKTDKKPGTERVFVLFCPQEAMLKYMDKALEFAYPLRADGTRNLDHDLQGAPAHCKMRSVLIRRTPQQITKK